MAAESDPDLNAYASASSSAGAAVRRAGEAARSAAAASIGFLRSQPLVAASLAAGAVGAGIGLALANRARKRQLRRTETLTRRAGLRLGEVPVYVRRARAVPDLLPPLIRLLRNPLVQSAVRRALLTAVSRRFRAR